MVSAFSFGNNIVVISISANKKWNFVIFKNERLVKKSNFLFKSQENATSASKRYLWV